MKNLWSLASWSTHLRPFALAGRVALGGSRLLAAASLFLAATGCTQYYTPSETTVWSEATRLPETTEPITVTLENAQIVGQEILVEARGDHRWLVDLHQWTESAVVLLRLGLEAKNYRVTGPADKTLKVSVTAAYMGGGLFDAFVEVVLAVSTSDAKLAIFKGRRPQSMFVMNQAFNDALKVAVGKALSSDFLIEYLTRPVGQVATGEQPARQAGDGRTRSLHRGDRQDLAARRQLRARDHARAAQGGQSRRNRPGKVLRRSTDL